MGGGAVEEKNLRSKRKGYPFLSNIEDMRCYEDNFQKSTENKSFNCYGGEVL